MQLISKYSKGTQFLLFVFDIFSKCAWVVSIYKMKKALQLLTLFENVKTSVDVNLTKYG